MTTIIAFGVVGGVLLVVGGFLTYIGVEDLSAPVGFVLLGILGIAAGITLVAVSAVQSVESRNCDYASTQYQRPTRWDFFAGCFIRTDSGQYVSLDKYVAVVNGGK